MASLSSPAGVADVSFPPGASRFLPAVPPAPHSSRPAPGLGLLRLRLAHSSGSGTGSSVTVLSPLQGFPGSSESRLAALAWLSLQGKSK